MYTFAHYLNIRSANSPVLSADGSRIAFLSDISGNFQVWSVSSVSDQPAWPQQLTFFKDKVWEIHGTAAASHLIAVRDIGGNERQQFYLITNYGAGNDEQGHKVRRLTSEDQAIHRFGAWSADGQEIVYTCNARNGLDFDYYRMDLGCGQTHLIRQSRGNRDIVAWSPDQNYLLINEHIGPLQNELYLLELNSGQERHLTAHTPPARYGQTKWSSNGIYLVTDRLHDQGSICRLDVDNGELTAIVSPSAEDKRGEMALLALDSAGQQGAYTFNANGYSQLYLFKPDKAEVCPISHLPNGVIDNIHFSSDGQQLVFNLQTCNRNPDIWMLNVVDGSSRQITDSNKAGIPNNTFVIPQTVFFNSFDDLEIAGFYYLPQQKIPTGGYRCILYIHGGPTHQTFPDFDIRFQYFLSQGYAIFGPNVRGSTGYGRKYAALDEIEKRMDSVADIKAAVEWLHGRPEINSDAIAIYGRSYGGFMVLAAMTEYPELFAAGIDVVGIANWVTFIERTGTWRRAHREQEYGSLEHHGEVLEQISPIHKAERIQAPLMVIAGDNDPRVPLFESQQIVERVEATGGSVKFIHYADEGHKISKLANRIDSFTQMAKFLKQHL